MTLRQPRALPFIAAALIAVVALSGCSSVKHLFGGRSKDKAGEPAKLVEFTPTVTVRQLWTAQIGKGEKNLGLGQHPVIVNGVVYAAAVDGGVTALDLTSGKTLWHYDSKSRLSGGPGAGDGLVVVGGLKGEVIALDAGTGQEKWTAKVNNEVISAPAIGGGMVFVRGNDGRVTAFDANTGERRWFYSADVPPLTVRGNGGITLGPGLLFVPGDDGSVVALGMADGSERWRVAVAEPEGRSELERMADVDGDVVLEGTVLFATSYKNHTVAIDGPRGQVLWDSEHGGPRGLGVSNSAVVVTDRNGNVIGLDKNTGGSLWQQSGLLNRNVTAPTVQGDYVVVGDYEGVVHWIRLIDGAFAARSKAGKAVTGKPVESDGIVVVQSVDGKLTAFSLQP
jgi:outer membrane protein assembly factor BamB